MGKDFREGWTVKTGKASTPWHYFVKDKRTSICGSWMRDGTGILASVHGVGVGGHCKSCLTIYKKTYPFEFSRGKVPHVPSISEVEIRHIDIIISNEDNETVFKAAGTVSRKTAHKFMEYVGAAYVPQEPLRALVSPARAVSLGKISCDVTGDCTDYPMKCSECHNNNAKSYFKPKVSFLSPTFVTVSIDPDRSGDYVIRDEENSEAVLKAVGEYLLATKKLEEEPS